MIHGVLHEGHCLLKLIRQVYMKEDATQEATEYDRDTIRLCLQSVDHINIRQRLFEQEENEEDLTKDKEAELSSDVCPILEEHGPPDVNWFFIIFLFASIVRDFLTFVSLVIALFHGFTFFVV